MKQRSTRTWQIPSLEAMDCFAQCFVAAVAPGDVVFLRGPLGVGKSSWVRFLLQAMGHADVVPSPTYALVHAYPDLPVVVHHFDLYRLHDLDELEAMGARDYFSDDAICLIEWPDLLKEWGVEPSIEIDFALADSEDSRQCTVRADQALIQHNQYAWTDEKTLND